MTDYQHLGPEHPLVLSAAAAFDAWWDKYHPLAFLAETILSEIPAGADPDTVWTEFDGEYESSIVAGFHISGREEVSGYWFTSRPWSGQAGDRAIVTEVRQYCENRDRASREGVTCSDCPISTGLCSGVGNQWCEIPNLRYPGGAPAYSLDELVELLGAGYGDDTEAMKNRGNIAYGTGDVATARRWWEQAAAAGNTAAMSNLGVLAQNDNDPARARQWFEQAAIAGNAVAMFNLGNIAYGDEDLEESRRWWERAAAQGHSAAIENLKALPGDTVESEEKIVSDDLAEARAQFERWAKNYERVFSTAAFEDLEKRGVPQNLIWTVLDDNDGSCIVTNGVVTSGRMSVVGYHVTRRSWSDGDNLAIVSDVDVPCAVCDTSGEVDGIACADCEGFGSTWITLDHDPPRDSSVLDGLK